MGRSLIVDGADFSVNGIAVPVDVTALAEAQTGTFLPRKSIAGFTNTAPGTNATRCCIFNLDVALFADMGRFSKLRIDIKPGFDYVIGVNRAGTNASADWKKLSGTSTGGSFSWVTTNQYILTPLSALMKLKGNIRYDNDTTSFSSSTKLHDVLTMTLIP